jgi:hypothetical protein
MNDARIMNGAVYVQTNEPENTIVSFRREMDGTLESGSEAGARPTATTGPGRVQGRVGRRRRHRASNDRPEPATIFRPFQATHRQDGSFAVRIGTRNTPGLDFFRARARNLATDEICRARAVI